MKKLIATGVFAVLASPVLAQDSAMAGDAEAGLALFERQCVACHVVQDVSGEVLAGRNSRTGPNLYNLIGQTPGTVEGYRYGKDLVAYGETGVLWEMDTIVP